MPRLLIALSLGLLFLIDGRVVPTGAARSAEGPTWTPTASAPADGAVTRLPLSGDARMTVAPSAGRIVFVQVGGPMVVTDLDGGNAVTTEIPAFGRGVLDADGETYWTRTRGVGDAEGTVTAVDVADLTVRTYSLPHHSCDGGLAVTAGTVWLTGCYVPHDSALAIDPESGTVVAVPMRLEAGAAATSPSAPDTIVTISYGQVSAWDAIGFPTPSVHRRASRSGSGPDDGVTISPDGAVVHVVGTDGTSFRLPDLDPVPGPRFESAFALALRTDGLAAAVMQTGTVGVVKPGAVEPGRTYRLDWPMGATDVAFDDQTLLVLAAAELSRQRYELHRITVRDEPTVAVSVTDRVRYGGVSEVRVRLDSPDTANRTVTLVAVPLDGSAHRALGSVEVPQGAVAVRRVRLDRTAMIRAVYAGGVGVDAGYGESGVAVDADVGVRAEGLRGRDVVVRAGRTVVVVGSIVPSAGRRCVVFETQRNYGSRSWTRLQRTDCVGLRRGSARVAVPSKRGSAVRAVRVRVHFRGDDANAEAFSPWQVIRYRR